MDLCLLRLAKQCQTRLQCLLAAKPPRHPLNHAMATQWLLFCRCNTIISLVVVAKWLKRAHRGLSTWLRHSPSGFKQGKKRRCPAVQALPNPTMIQRARMMAVRMAQDIGPMSLYSRRSSRDSVLMLRELQLHVECATLAVAIVWLVMEVWMCF